VIPLSLGEIAAVVGGTVEGDRAVTVTAPAVLDGRQAEPSGLFVAFAGEHVDGHHYADQAGRAGAVAVLGSRPTALPTVVVEDAQAALQALAAHVVARLRDGLTVVGLTGSQGKTSTKDLLAAVLSSAAPTIATIGSLNNELGVPLTMLRADAATRFLVLEMGARRIGDIAELTGLVVPDIAVVLNVGQAHLGEFGSREAIAKARPSPPTCGCSAWRWTGSAGRPSRWGPPTPRLPSRCRWWAPTRRSTRRLPRRRGWRPAYLSTWPRRRWPPPRCRSGAWSCATSPAE
jgi:UDP-N-acetylmuramoyl-tripeptide--D-alanyl-D-alanine ligase